MLDFYTEIAKFKKQQEPKRLRNNIEVDKYDIVEIAISMLNKLDKKVK